MSIREIHIPPKKTSRQNSLTSVGNVLTQTVNQPISARLEQEEQSVTFYNEVSDIMRGFGDSEHPIRESVLLIEKIVQQQLRGILNEALKVAHIRRGAPSPTQVDFEFLMRKNPTKINRMRKHIKDMKLLRKIVCIQAIQAGRLKNDNGESNQDSDEDTETEIIEKFDAEKARRLFRADRISQILSGTQYQKFNEARRTSFYCRHSEEMKHKFKAFLSVPTEIRLPKVCVSILAYLAHETIATIVDFAILTRLNSENRITDPYSRVTSSGVSFGMLHLCPEVTQGRGMDGVKSITVQEIQEALRRFNQTTNKKMGFHRNNVDNEMQNNYLAL